MSENRCESCNEMQRLVNEYIIDLEKIQELVDKNILELYAGNCYPKEISNHMDIGKHYTINTYYHCSKCSSYYYLAFCLYGRPIIKEVNKSEAENRALHLEWGFLGTYFKEDVKLDKINELFRTTSYITEPVWGSLIKTFNYGTATPMQALIKTLRILYERVRLGGTVDLYYPADGNKQVIKEETFDEVIRFYFDDFVLSEVKKKILF